MKPKRRQSGLTLVEMTVAIAIIAAMAVLAVPAVKQLNKSMGSPAESRAVIASALSRARNMAISNRKYVGVRFQIAGAVDFGSLTREQKAAALGKANQYMVFIEKDENKSAYWFKAMEGTRPIKLPDNTLVIDTKYRSQTGDAEKADYISFNDTSDDSEVENNLCDIMTFSIIFSPAGKMVMQQVRIRNKDHLTNNNNSYDEVFNTLINVQDGAAAFLQDDYPELGYGLGQEYSSREFWIAERDRFGKELKNGTAYSGYLENDVPRVSVNGYTGELLGAE